MIPVGLNTSIPRLNTTPDILLTGFDEVRLEKTDSEQLRIDKVLKKPLLNLDLAYAIRKILDGKPNR